MLKKTGLFPERKGSLCIKGFGKPRGFRVPVLWTMVLWMFFVSGTATGAALIVKPSVSARFYYDDNAALTTRPHDPSSGSELLGAIKLSRNTAAMELQGVARLNVLLDAGGDVYRDKDNQALS